ncbi:2-C-methyl-D-erythritol 4-phosphate cytidylyltransferase [Enterococcus casseliflavus]|uniref:IspD/TarI family cytidylyltransferase n=1 Tax=Enterococcus casseliflavus TaxID=37734 RepID=UPI0022E0BBB9|nr:2-C-methyl-D-erythritol 4-phosphate cytidylyltransferase [Enterococcus casseliflavus]MEB6087102.1 2-C-methyl-D-erythritol 4-phosphate cytidylyltransferase [Enterococcus casseliflavus]
MLYAQILAGGKGTRMGNVGMPKQFLQLGNRPIIIHTLEKFVLNDAFDAIIVSCPENWIQHAKDIIAKYIHDERVKIIAGGKERNDTLKSGIAFIHESFGQHDDDVIVVHDAVRPFISRRIIEDNIRLSKTYNAIDTVIPATDTIVRGNGSEVTEIPIRDEMYQGQTPQTFNINVFLDCLNKLSEEDIKTLSDSCKICLLSGEKVGLVEGSTANIKVTTPFDLKIAKAIIEERE